MATERTHIGTETVEGRIKGGRVEKLANLFRRAFRRPPLEERKIEIQIDRYNVPISEGEAEVMCHHFGG